MSEFSKGGLIPVRENRQDIVEVVLSQGYFVPFPKAVVERYGLDVLNRLNEFQRPSIASDTSNV
jgi:hypothetical protein